MSQFSHNFSAIFRNWFQPPLTAIPPPPGIEHKRMLHLGMGGVFLTQMFCVWDL